MGSIGSVGIPRIDKLEPMCEDGICTVNTWLEIYMN